MSVSSPDVSGETTAVRPPQASLHAPEGEALVVEVRAAGLSLGDRACLALGRTLARKVLTADRAWKGLAIDGVEVELIR